MKDITLMKNGFGDKVSRSTEWANVNTPVVSSNWNAPLVLPLTIVYVNGWFNPSSPVSVACTVIPIVSPTVWFSYIVVLYEGWVNIGGCSLTSYA